MHFRVHHDRVGVRRPVLRVLAGGRSKRRSLRERIVDTALAVVAVGLVAITLKFVQRAVGR